MRSPGADGVLAGLFLGSSYWGLRRKRWTVSSTQFFQVPSRLFGIGLLHSFQRLCLPSWSLSLLQTCCFEALLSEGVRRLTGPEGRAGRTSSLLTFPFLVLRLGSGRSGPQRPDQVSLPTCLLAYCRHSDAPTKPGTLGNSWSAN